MKAKAWKSLGDQWEDRALRRAGDVTDRPKHFVLTVLVVAVLVVLSVTVLLNVVGVASIYWRAAVAKKTVGARVTQQVYGTDNAYFNLGYFHNQCQTVLEDQQNVSNAVEQLAQDRKTLAVTTDPIAQTQAGSAVTQDVATLTGTLDQLSHDTHEYNARSATSTANPFKAHNLPVRFSLKSDGQLKGSPNCK